MLKTYFLIAIRSLKKDRLNGVISLSGLVIGLAGVMLISGYIRFETSFDRGYSNADRIYRIISSDTRNDYGRTEIVPAAFGPTVVREIPDVAAQTHINTYTSQALLNNEYADLLQSLVDSNFFSVFNFEFLLGNPKTALSSESNIVLTASTAKKFFGTTDVIGKTIVTRDSTKIITGVIQDIPQNSFFKTDAFFFYPLKNQILSDVNKGFNGRNAFVLLNRNTSAAAVTEKIKNLCQRHLMDNFRITLQPVHQIHLQSSDIKDSSSEYNTGDLKYVYIYGCIALLILVIGCINFINLCIAHSMERTKEVGMRKVLGANRKQLVTQFLGEAALYFIIAFVIAIILAIALWNEFTQLSNISAGQSFLLNTYTLLVITGVCIFACLLSGFYPALFLSKLRPVSTLKGSLDGVKLNFNLRKVLLVVQFSISVFLIVATLTVHSQLSYLNSRSLGFNKDNLVRFNVPFLEKGPQAFIDKILQNPAIEGLTLSSLSIGRSYSASFAVKDNDTTKFLSCAYLDADLDFIKNMQVPIISGRGFSRTYPSDIVDYDSIAGFFGVDTRRPLVVSESFVKAMGIKDPIGKIINKDSFLKGTIVGVFKDFNAMSLKEAAPMLVIRCKANGKYLPDAFARINAKNTSESIRYISKTYKEFFPQEKFDFAFVDDRIAHLYDAELRLTKLSNLFAFIAITLSCMGLFSLVSLMVRKRTKEIGIRKVMGASVNNIVMIISKDFIYLLIVSFFIAIPLAYMAVNKWLQSYANRTELYWWIFVIGGMAAILIALLTVSMQTIKAAVANPVKSLRAE